MSDLEPYEVVEVFEQLLIQEECPHSKQELRTIIFKEKGFDVYFQGCHFYPCNSTSWEVGYIQIHALQGSSLVSLFEFHEKRHFMEIESVMHFKGKEPS